MPIGAVPIIVANLFANAPALPPLAGVAYVMPAVGHKKYTVPPVGSMVMIRGGWQDMQPTANGPYDFTSWDITLSAVPPTSKVIIAMWGGQSSPLGGSWKSFAIKVPKVEGHAFPCKQIVQPIPWDTNYLSGLAAAHLALLNHIQTSFPTLWPRIVEWSVGAISGDDAEMGLPSNSPCEPEMNTRWQQAGLTPAVLAGAQDQFNVAVMPALPPNARALEVFLNGRDGGGYFGGPSGDGTLAMIVAHGQEAAPGHLAIQTSNWNWVVPPGPFLTTAYQAGAVIDTQGMPVHVCADTPCTLAKFNAAVQTWYNAGTRVFEVYTPQVKAFTPQLNELDSALRAGKE